MLMRVRASAGTSMPRAANTASSALGFALGQAPASPSAKPLASPSAKYLRAKSLWYWYFVVMRLLQVAACRNGQHRKYKVIVQRPTFPSGRDEGGWQAKRTRVRRRRPRGPGRRGRPVPGSRPTASGSVITGTCPGPSTRCDERVVRAKLGSASRTRWQSPRLGRPRAAPSGSATVRAPWSRRPASCTASTGSRVNLDLDHDCQDGTLVGYRTRRRASARCSIGRELGPAPRRAVSYGGTGDAE